MAHQTNITQVEKEIPASEQSTEVTDPVCGMKLDRKRCRHMLFRDEGTYYFCSRDCEQKFMSRGFRPDQSKAA
jgi:Cu+-exporting ATPase